MQNLIALAVEPATWAALATLIVLEVVLGIDNLVFVAILSNKLPAHLRHKARRVGISLALILRLALLATLTFIIGLTEPVFTLPLPPPVDSDGHAILDFAFSWRDLILMTGGMFLLWKASGEIREKVDVGHIAKEKAAPRVASHFAAAIAQILVLDLVFSIDSILTAVGMTNQLPIMIVAVIVAVGLMMVAADALSDFIGRNPTIVMLALGFLLVVGVTLIADSLGIHIAKGYIYAAMGFGGLVEGLNMLARRADARLAKP